MRKYILGLAGLALIVFGLAVSSWKSVTSAEPLAFISQTDTVKTAIVSKDSLYDAYINDIYATAHLSEAGLSFVVFEKAVTGFYNLKNAGQLSARRVLTIADFDQLSTRKRLYVIDLEQEKLLLNTWVAHGQRSGDNEASYFSNEDSSYASSLGFYVTGEAYYGKHGRSLRLDGVDNGFNDHARSRAIVVHGADYVSQGTINALGRLGRSQGCPAVAPELADKVINQIAHKTVLFINKSDENYASKYLDATLAANFALDGVESID